MRYTKYILLLFAILIASCTAEDIVTIESINNNSNIIQIVCRSLPFDDMDVSTRASNSEDDINMIDMAIFGTNSNDELVCVYYQHSNNQIINLDRAIFNDMDQNLLEKCYISIVANFPGIYDKICAEVTDTNNDGEISDDEVETYVSDNIIGKKGTDYFLNSSIQTEHTVDIPSQGLPRVGSYGTAVDFRSDADIPGGTTYEIPLMSLYSRIVFDTNVDAIEAAVGEGNKLVLESFTVHNIVKTMDLTPGIPSDSALINGSDDSNLPVHDNSITVPIDYNTHYIEENVYQFSFYLPERFMRAKTAANVYEYPFGKGDGIRKEDEKLRQRYKPELAHDKATYVTLNGVFTNHQGHSYDVSYNIYLGNDNFGNFDLVRNKQYNNHITIKGINNANDQSNVTGAVSIDHRVNISRTLPVILNLRRETLLDAHFEIRPLRIRKNVNHSGGNNTATHVKVEVEYNDDSKPQSNGNGNWIGLERSYGVDYTEVANTSNSPNPSLYCTNGSAAGKRKYFTYDLVDPALYKNDGTGDVSRLHNSTTVYVPINAEECVWIYVDECTESSADIGAIRSAKIKVTCGTYNGTNFTPTEEPLVYTINQHKLFEVTWEGRTYLIEHEEEYLHNFDSDDTYGNNKTEFEGIEWGLYNAQLSFDNPALFFKSIFNLDFISNLLNSWTDSKTVAKYDFYVKKHDTEEKGVPDNDNNMKREYSGHTFCEEIIKDINTKNDATRNTGYEGTIGSLTLATIPNCAIEYAYNRNKRNRDGSVANMNWYLPAIDEMEDIMMGGHNSFDEFHGQFYWSSQPSYLQNYAYHEQNYIIWTQQYEGTYYTDDTGMYYDRSGTATNKIKFNNGFARATKANHISGNDFKYAESGIEKGYDDAYNAINKTLIRSGTYQNQKLQAWEDWDPTNLDNNVIKRQEGNFERSTKHRVRCVYKQTTQ